MYAKGDLMTVRVAFPRTIQSAMGARLNTRIGENARAAAASDCTNCGMYLDFLYTVVSADYDADGADPLPRGDAACLLAGAARYARASANPTIA